MNEKLSSVSADVEKIKRNPQPHQVAQPPGGNTPDAAYSALRTHSVSPSEVPQDGDTVITRLSWADRMELEDEVDDELETTEEQPKGDKIRLTKVLQPTEDFLREAFNPINNTSRRQLRQQFIVPDTPFTTAPRLDKMIADECSKSVKTSDQSFSRIQALFLDAVGPLSGMLNSINKGTELAVEDVESAIKAALNFLGNASSQCTSLRRTGILREYNKDLVSYGLESNKGVGDGATSEARALPLFVSSKSKSVFR